MSPTAGTREEDAGARADGAASVGWTAVCRVADIPVLGARRVDRGQGLPVAVFRNADDKVFALLDRCPHKGGPLSEGIVHGTAVTCPLHAWVFSLETGQAQGADAGTVATYPVRVADGRILLDGRRLARRVAA